jgi:hypothetical protein
MGVLEILKEPLVLLAFPQLVCVAEEMMVVVSVTEIVATCVDLNQLLPVPVKKSVLHVQRC